MQLANTLISPYDEKLSSSDAVSICQRQITKNAMHRRIVKFDLAEHTQRCNINRYIYNNYEKYLHFILVV